MKKILFLLLVTVSLNATAQTEKPWLEKAMQLYENTDFDSSKIYFTKLIELHPDSIQLYYNRALVNYALNDFEGSLIDFTKVIRETPNDVKSLEWRAKINLELNNFNDALTDYEKAYELTGNSDLKQKIRICNFNHFIANYWLYMIVILIAFIFWLVYLFRAIVSK